MLKTGRSRQYLVKKKIFFNIERDSCCQLTLVYKQIFITLYAPMYNQEEI